MSRKSIAESLKREVLTESGYRCAVPTCRTILAIDLHHIVEVSEGGGNDFNNLIALCPTCHALYHRGTITKDSIKVWKGILVSLNGAFDKVTIDDLIFLYKIELKQQIILSGDGILKFSKLISADLAEYKIIQWDNRTFDRKYTICLSAKGKLFVEAWLNGNSDSLNQYYKV